MNHLIQKADSLLKDSGFDYIFCGGFAIELYLDKAVRNHGDIDVSAFGMSAIKSSCSCNLSVGAFTNCAVAAKRAVLPMSPIKSRQNAIFSV